MWELKAGRAHVHVYYRLQLGRECRITQLFTAPHISMNNHESTDLGVTNTFQQKPNSEIWNHE